MGVRTANVQPGNIGETIEGLASLRSAEEVAKMRGKTVEELLG